jgi:hypothetical protein
MKNKLAVLNLIFPVGKAPKLKKNIRHSMHRIFYGLPIIVKLPFKQKAYSVHKVNKLPV